MNAKLAKYVTIVTGSRIVLVVLLFFLYDPTPRGPALPDLNTVAKIEATYYVRNEPDFVTFDLPKRHWQSIYDALTPATHDGNPAKWTVLGDLRITLINGEPFEIQLYQLPEIPGAFSSGKTRDTRTYYRGGSTNELLAALNAARKDVKLEDGN